MPMPIPGQPKEAFGFIGGGGGGGEVSGRGLATDVGELGQAIEGLKQEWNTIRERLGPVMAPAAPTPNAAGMNVNKEQPRSTLSMTLQSMAGDLRMLLWDLRNVNSRLEV